jgi:hypothetical protein
MAALTFSIDEALNVLLANDMVPAAVRDLKPDRDGLRVTVSGGIEIAMRQESFSNGVLKLSFGSKNWAFKLADSLGKVDAAIDEAVRDFPFIHREDKSLFIDLNWALQTRIRGMQVKDFQLRDGAVNIEF